MLKKFSAVCLSIVVLAFYFVMPISLIAENELTDFFGDAKGITVFVEGNFTVTGADTEGIVAVGGDFSSDSPYGVGTHYAETDTIRGFFNGGITNLAGNRGTYAISQDEEEFRDANRTFEGNLVPQKIDFAETFALLRETSKTFALMDAITVDGNIPTQLIRYVFNENSIEKHIDEQDNIFRLKFRA